MRIGVTGHRLNQIPEAVRPALRGAVAQCLALLGGCAREAGHGFAKLTLISAIAEGADRYAAQAALDLGWRLECPLPFLRARYEEDFPDPAAIAAFRGFLKHAAWVHEIDGAALQAQGLGSAAPYAAVGREIVARAGTLLAVWNGAPPKGPGGTAEVCALALEKGEAVVWLTPDMSAGPRLILPEARRVHTGSFRARFYAALKQRFDVVGRPAEMRVAPP
jgi:hypothetical protein